MVLPARCKKGNLLYNSRCGVEEVDPSLADAFCTNLHGAGTGCDYEVVLTHTELLERLDNSNNFYTATLEPDAENWCEWREGGDFPESLLAPYSKECINDPNSGCNTRR